LYTGATGGGDTQLSGESLKLIYEKGAPWFVLRLPPLIRLKPPFVE
jgi:hypothetical protein